ncbi:helix-turn-helix domain-containing protein [Clostridium botulinum]|uniref:Transcriptional regulator n=1 Tax=Clostridium botulinum TaxID=1491 RepID=A0A9Q1UXG1_CLOBO|nr:helix-turn-helix domain-containing protein [Clostridium botulinum]AEB75866.1 putative transcriptional regulator [Clostridium botulinum BKT015925]KEH97182.1 transcriptional regulator [Clostridium botulinum D str. 16868]KEI04708.1 transcriptional regulator [Clostridium botulinum C/D str. Sp77]KLU76922.1 transcriptional regulator [Clostridium botulinum V891]KOA75231.1 transcriptional regulator [Clostridium botulinum]
MNKTEKLKHIILSKYTSIREFSKIVDIPSTTLTSALDKNIGGMAVDRIIKICDVLNIDIKTFEPLNNSSDNSQLSHQEKTLIKNFNKLNDLGKEKVVIYTQDLLDNPKFSTNDEICATKVPYLVACHNDDLSKEEKDAMDKKINAFLNK